MTCLLLCLMTTCRSDRLSGQGYDDYAGVPAKYRKAVLDRAAFFVFCKCCFSLGFQTLPVAWCFLVEFGASWGGRAGVCCVALRGDVLRRVVFNPLEIKLFLIIAAPKTGQRLSGWCCESEIYALRDRIWHRSDCCENSLASFKMYSIPEAEGFDELRIGGEFVSWP